MWEWRTSLKWLGRGRMVGLFAGLVVVAGIGAHDARADDRVSIVATIAQIGEPVGRIVGDCGRVETLLGEGVDPHLYAPTRSDIVRLTRADVILLNGHNLEPQLRNAIRRLSDGRVVLAVAETLPSEALLPWEDGHYDPHIWMDPVLWRQALAAAVDALAERVPGCADEMRERATAYFDEVEALRAYMDRVLSEVPASDRVLVTAHDAFAYLGSRFGLELIGIQGISTESEVGLRRIEELVRLLVDRGIASVFVETSVADRSVRALIEGAAARGHRVEIGGELYSDAMGAPGTWEGTYIGMLDHNATVIARALGGVAPEGGMAGKLGAAAARPGN